MKRTKAQPIGALLDELFRSPNIAAKIAEGALPDVWRQVVGPLVAAQTRQVRLVRGVLYVHVASSVVRHELMMQRESLVRALNERSGVAVVQSLVVQ
ncbi:MAG: DUF721 domain-containing protein [Alistipes sp.]|jgi:predicted nucleic acid-binding Zn ribbon protein|nr:DUF721 domain-containing protein [Alistipes sp.]